MKNEFENYRPKLKAFAHAKIPRYLRSKIGASDLVQSTFLRASIAKRDESVDNVEGWLKLILQRVFLDKVKFWNRNCRDARRTTSCDVEYCASPNVSNNEDELADVLRAALCTLSKAEKEVVKLKFVEDLNLGEIAEETGKTKSAVAGLLKRAKRKIRDNSELRIYFDGKA